MPSTTAAPGNPPPSKPTNPYTSDPFLQPFLGPTFDPTAYLNSTLPPLSVSSSTTTTAASTTNTATVSAKSSSSSSSSPSAPLPISDLASRAQTHVARLTAHSTRLSDALTDLADGILRTGPRLAYSVELLRGEAVALAEALAETLAVDIKAIVPEGLEEAAAAAAVVREEEEEQEKEGEEAGSEKEKAAAASAALKDDGDRNANGNEPADLSQLRALHLVRERLQEVIRTFDAALAWPLPPSSLSLAQSLVSVSAPAAGGTGADAVSAEEQGQKAQRELQESVAELLAPAGKGSAGPEGVLRAEARVAEIRALVEVWKGTAEEKARTKFVESLEKTVAEKRREEEGKGALRGVEEAGRTAEPRASTEVKKGGLFEGLRRLREEIYLE